MCSGMVMLLVYVLCEGDVWCLLFEVVDMGIGIDIIVIIDIFCVYQQVQVVNGGIGFGLFIVQWIVVVMGGELVVVSQLGVGMLFLFVVVVLVFGYVFVLVLGFVRWFYLVDEVQLVCVVFVMCSLFVDVFVELIVFVGEGWLIDIEEWFGQYVDELDYVLFVYEMCVYFDVLDLYVIEKLVGLLKCMCVVDMLFDIEMDVIGLV